MLGTGFPLRLFSRCVSFFESTYKHAVGDFMRRSFSPILMYFSSFRNSRRRNRQKSLFGDS
jgi:hypothetical protein